MYQPSPLPRADGVTGGHQIDRGVIASIRSAAQTTGVDFGYLMAQAGQESSFQPNARATGSSAAGLYQFVDSTWLQMMHDYGAKYGMADLASAVHSTAQGTFSVADPATRQRILALRNDPKTAAVFGAEYARSNRSQLEQTLGRKTNATDLYMAHFLGPNGASDFLKGMQGNPAQPAASLLPQAASANPAVFYDSNGQARSLGAIYKSFQSSIGSKAISYAALANGSGAAALPAIASAGMGAGTASGAIDGRFKPLLPSTGAGGPITGYQPQFRPMLSLSSVAALSVYDTLGHLTAPTTHASDRHDAYGAKPKNGAA